MAAMNIYVIYSSRRMWRKI